MVESISNILKYLEKKDIYLDKKEFSYQVNSHPAFPSLLSIVSALNVNKISNYAIEIDNSEINELPEDFMTFIEFTDHKQEFTFVEKISGGYLISGKHKMSEKDFLLKWNNIVVLLDEPGTFPVKKKKRGYRMLFVSIIIVALLIYSYYQMNIFRFIYLFLSLCGFLLSVLSLRKVFGIESPVMNKVCSGTYTDCSFSEEEKNRSFISGFGDYSLVYFFTNIISVLYLDTITFITMQKILLIIIVPIVGYSLFYQFFRIKKVCPVCIGIITLLLLQTYILFL
ncbi:vitamin K epoxide reductase family protein [Chryseobacterium bernardetii]|uniref:vitamin K epoxide reductase family protein n=1 Tax=Chryseobacterium bernardetii TaxID=1241978 RepID=UPI0030182AB2